MKNKFKKEANHIVIIKEEKFRMFFSERKKLPLDAESGNVKILFFFFPLSILEHFFQLRGAGNFHFSRSDATRFAFFVR